MSYDLPNRQKHAFGLFDWGAAADEVFYFIGDKGKAGRLYNYGVEGTIEVFNGNTVTPKISVGKSGTLAAYGVALDLNALADNTAKSVRSLYRESDAGFATYMTDATRIIPADTQIACAVTGATGAPTGQAVPFVIVDWDW